MGFVVTLGYFPATRRFFARWLHQTDLDYITGQLGYLPGLITLDSYAKSVQSRHRTLILDYLGFRPFNTQARQEIAAEIHTMVRSHMRPKPILLRVLEILESQKTEISSEIIGMASHAATGCGNARGKTGDALSDGAIRLITCQHVLAKD